MEKERYEEIFRDQALSEGGLRSGGYAIGGARPTKGRRHCVEFNKCDTKNNRYKCIPRGYKPGPRQPGEIVFYDAVADCSKGKRGQRPLLNVEKQALKIKKQEARRLQEALIDAQEDIKELKEAQKMGSGHKKGYKCIKEGYGPSGKKRCEKYEAPSGGYRHKKGYKGDRYCVEEEYGPSGKKRCKKYEPGSGGARRVKRGGSEANFEAAERSPWISFLLQVANDTGLTYADVLKDARKGSPRRQEILDAYAQYKRDIPLRKP